MTNLNIPQLEMNKNSIILILYSKLELIASRVPIEREKKNRFVLIHLSSKKAMIQIPIM
jgi:hypothetical protein